MGKMSPIKLESIYIYEIKPFKHLANKGVTMPWQKM